jgi:hypothetical protein
MDGFDQTNTWMSTTAFEIESQMIGLAEAHGTTVVFGFGMGWLAVNVALRPEVERVIVVERNPDIIAISKVNGVFDGLAPDVRAKIEVIQGDALTWKPDCKVDTLQADIWPQMFYGSLLGDVRQMQDNVRATRMYYWGQEVEIFRRAQSRHGKDVELDWAMIREAVDLDIKLPLILPDWDDYPAKIMACMRHFGPNPDAEVTG